MALINQDDEMWKGDSHSILYTVTDETGTAVDLSNTTIVWWMGKTPRASGNNIFIQKSSANSGIALTGTTGQFLVSVAEADTANVVAGNYYHESKVAFSNGAVFTVSTGRFVLYPSIINTAV